jgi:uncharacterized protein (DUF433 family)
LRDFDSPAAMGVVELMGVGRGIECENVMSKTSKIVHTDSFGAMRVAETRISLDSVVVAYLQGHSPATIQQQYPSLTVEQVDAAIEYYLAHRGQVDEYLRRQDENWRRLRAESEQKPAAVVERLRSMRPTEVEP